MTSSHVARHCVLLQRNVQALIQWLTPRDLGDVLMMKEVPGNGTTHEKWKRVQQFIKEGAHYLEQIEEHFKHHVEESSWFLSNVNGLNDLNYSQQFLDHLQSLQRADRWYIPTGRCEFGWPPTHDEFPEEFVGRNANEIVESHFRFPYVEECPTFRLELFRCLVPLMELFHQLLEEFPTNSFVPENTALFLAAEMQKVVNQETKKRDRE